MGEEIQQAGYHPADINGDEVVTKEEEQLYIEYKQKELEDQDARRDAMRKMAWFALIGMLLYPFAVVVASLFGLVTAVSTLGTMAATYYVSVAAIVVGYMGANAYTDKKKDK